MSNTTRPDGTKRNSTASFISSNKTGKDKPRSNGGGKGHGLDLKAVTIRPKKDEIGQKRPNATAATAATADLAAPTFSVQYKKQQQHHAHIGIHDRYAVLESSDSSGGSDSEPENSGDEERPTGSFGNLRPTTSTTWGWSRRPRASSTATTTTTPGSHLEMARARAFQAGVLPVWQFILSSLAHPKPILPTSHVSAVVHPISAPVGKPSTDVSTRMYAATGQPIPAHASRGEIHRQKPGEEGRRNRIQRLEEDDETAESHQEREYRNTMADHNCVKMRPTRQKKARRRRRKYENKKRSRKDKKEAGYQSQQAASFRQASATKLIHINDGVGLNIETGSLDPTPQPIVYKSNRRLVIGDNTADPAPAPASRYREALVAALNRSDPAAPALTLRGHTSPSQHGPAWKVPTTCSCRSDNPEPPGELDHSDLKNGSLDDSHSDYFEASSTAADSPRRYLLPIPEPIQSLDDMEGANTFPRPTEPVRRATGSWDTLINHNRTRRATLSQESPSENEVRRNLQTRGVGDMTIGGGGASSRMSQNVTPMRPRMVMHHHDQRSSLGSTTHAIPLKKPSPLGMSMSSDSLPELNIGGGFPKNSDYDIGATRQNTFPRAPLKKPAMYAKPQRLSSAVRPISSEAASASAEAQRPGSIASFDPAVTPGSRMRAMSWTASPGEDRLPPFQTHSRTNSPPVSYPGGRQQRRLESISRHKSKPNEMFNRLPHEVVRLIMDHLKDLHLSKRSGSCATCWMRDCCSMALCNRKSLQVARAALYDNILLVGADSAHQRKKYRGVYPTRLVLLRRSLRADNRLAEMVRSIKVPALPEDASIDNEAYHDIVASVVMACPNLERLDGFYPTYNHSHSRLFHALGSRSALKEMTWVMDTVPTEPETPEPERRGHQSRRSQSRSQSRSRHSKHGSSVSAYSSRRYSDPRNYLLPQFANNFVLQHSCWQELSHLTIHCLPGANLTTPNGLITVVLTYLPSLKSLYLSNVPARSFDDNALLSIPRPLKKLSLCQCTGVSTAGLSAFVSQPSAADLETLTLVHQNIDSLPAIVRILSKLTKLTKFSLVQALAPILPSDTFIWLMPYLASSSLKHLHWDIFESGFNDREGEGGTTKADDILLRSIKADGFPNLRNLRIPRDPKGLFQAICRPTERVDLPGDRYRNGPINQVAPNAVWNFGSRPSSSKGGQTAKPAFSTNPYGGGGMDTLSISDLADGRFSVAETRDSGKFLFPVHEAGSDLHQSRLAAQSRLETARRFPRFEVTVTDEKGDLIESSGLAAYLGDVSSRITYYLSPDPNGGTDERGGLAGIAELLSDRGEDLSGKGDMASMSGTGYGTGCIASTHTRAQTGEPKDAAGGKLTKGGKKTQAADGGETATTTTRTREGCYGRWNASQTDQVYMVDKKTVDWGWHTERGRWKGRVELS